MSPTPTAVASLASSSNLAQYQTPSVDPVPGELYLIAVHAKDSAGAPTVPTLAGLGHTWDLVEFVSSGLDVLAVYRAKADGGLSSGVIVIDFAGSTQDCCSCSVTRWTGFRPGGTNGSEAVRQPKKATGTGQSLSIALDPFHNGANATFGAFMHGSNEAAVAGDGFTPVHNVSHASPNRGLFAEWKGEPDQSVDASWIASVLALGIALEVRSDPSVYVGALIAGAQAPDPADPVAPFTVVGVAALEPVSPVASFAFAGASALEVYEPLPVMVGQVVARLLALSPSLVGAGPLPPVEVDELIVAASAPRPAVGVAVRALVAGAAAFTPVVPAVLPRGRVSLTLASSGGHSATLGGQRTTVELE